MNRSTLGNLRATTPKKTASKVMSNTQRVSRATRRERNSSMATMFVPSDGFMAKLAGAKLVKDWYGFELSLGDIAVGEGAEANMPPVSLAENGQPFDSNVLVIGSAKEPNLNVSLKGFCVDADMTGVFVAVPGSPIDLIRSAVATATGRDVSMVKLDVTQNGYGGTLAWGLVG